MVENTLATVQTQRTELVEFISCLQVGPQPPNVTDGRLLHLLAWCELS